MSTSDLPHKLPFRQSLPIEGSLDDNTFTLKRETHPEVISGRESIQHSLPEEGILEIPRPDKINGAIPSPEDIKTAQEYESISEVPDLIEGGEDSTIVAPSTELSAESFLAGLGGEQQSAPVAQEAQPQNNEEAMMASGVAPFEHKAPHSEHFKADELTPQESHRKAGSEDALLAEQFMAEREKEQEYLASQGR